MQNNNIISLTEEHITKFFKENISAEFVFHDLQHTRNVVDAVIEIGKGFNLTDKEIEILQLAAWFHDSGYDKGGENHEERGAYYATEFLSHYLYPNDNVKQVRDCIMATKMPQSPKSMLEKIICDADMSHLGKKNYWDRCERIRQEMMLTRGIIMNEEEWLNFELDFMSNHRYHTPIAQSFYNKRKDKHIRQLRKEKIRINPQEAFAVEEMHERNEPNIKQAFFALNNLPKKKKEEENKGQSLGRGVETMYRTTYQTHINLSAMADHKANLMISINTICISIAVSTLIPRIVEKNHNLILPTGIFLATCLTAMVFATLSTRPKITEGKFSREDIEQKRANLLFFGNFYNMKLEDFHWGMMQMIKDQEFLYTSMTKDIYFLGVVLSKKYRYLSLCYNIFMYGLIASVLAFAVAFMF